MSDTSTQLADKLTSEGERTLAFFRAIPPEKWDAQLYTDGAQWSIRQAFEHLCISEHGMKRLCEQIVYENGNGAAKDFDIDAYNKSKTNRFAQMSNAELQALYAETRQQTTALARKLTDEQLALRGNHPAMGDSSVQDILKMLYIHNTMHVKDVKKALG
ncbi:MAG TPA: DinB family protein [Thermoflexales bacterium]|nr:DinB family protein [Thermoflexales bacterium]HQW35037.1 DinB family protein [Thermoflexales bacterium]HQX75168.1 DinB family protein [Thermoflexales bacterium]HQZ22037.1 DinB family protein [Thermoflexales bacterium]HQZ99785.1 DinB family protein [Thermoflexales bacterium]